METNNFDPNLNPLSKKNRQENLEVSSTGYGLESVQKETAEVRDKEETSKKSCGGL
ncbi:hypothetical protein [Heyndrickxia acidiproducens]|uniref:hypothetical protein n=1 Tax=Heyndrickxia acidiproducens TaxID=1121084 RepID=UPI0003825040|nr:hypothetical protein [Heyndrickxia acidiproducens]